MSLAQLLYGPESISDEDAEARVRQWVRRENLNVVAVTLYRTKEGVFAHVQTDSRLSAIDMLTLHVELTPALDVDLAKTKPARQQVDDKLVLMRKLWPGRYRDTLAQVWDDTGIHDPWYELREDYAAFESAAEGVMQDMRFDDVCMAEAYGF